MYLKPGHKLTHISHVPEFAPPQPDLKNPLVEQSSHCLQAFEEEAEIVDEYFPASQGMHTADEEAETSLEYFPATQDVHVVDDATEEYLPASQDKHIADDEAETTAEYFPASQD
jgi:hypothetical protein